MPFAVDWRIDRHRVFALGTAVAAGLMLAACGMLLAETTDEPVWRNRRGLSRWARPASGGTHPPPPPPRWLERLGDVHVYELRGADARKALLIMGVMTAHSAAEGVGVGVSFVETERLGLTMATVIAIHNIPEGLAIALVLVPRGVGWIAAGVLGRGFQPAPADAGGSGLYRDVHRRGPAAGRPGLRRRGDGLGSPCST